MDRLVSKFGPDVVLNNPAYVHDTALLYGKVTVGENASIWANVVVRSELEEVVIGRDTNIQDFVMLHVGSSTGTYIGEACSITHHCTIHGCRIGDNCLIGIGSTLMDGAVIGDNSIVGPHTLVREGTKVPPNSVVVGAPSRVVRTRNNFIANRMNAFLYVQNALAYAKNEHRVWSTDQLRRDAMEEMGRLQRLSAEADAAKT